LGTVLVATPAAAANDDNQCQDETIPVTLTADPTIYHLYGQLCWQGTLAGKTVQLLTSGITYDHTYWDFPLQPQHYSYIRSAVDAGYATLNIDRLGVGQSDHPPADALTVPAEAGVNHQIIQFLRHGDIAGTSFAKIVAVGHSLGSGISVYEASTYADVDGVIVSGLLHALNPDSFSGFFAIIYPASEDPKFATAGLPPGYVTTRPGGRAFFYNTAYADPAVIARDEQLKQTGTSGEVDTFGLGFDPTLSQQIHVPVLVVVGQQDVSYCNEALPGFSCTDGGTVNAREGFAYPPQACLETYVLPSSGHDVNLHPDAHLWFEQATDWTARRIGNAQPPSQPC
jgi:pimeloyl-ACP methyl ester carboxylesterase